MTIGRCKVLVLTGLLVLLGSPVAELFAQTPAGDRVQRGYLAVQLGEDGPRVVDELNADRLFVPASVLKVVTVATALDRLGPDHRWVTRLRATGQVSDGVLDGDLVVTPAADPTWNDDVQDGGATRPLRELVEQVQAGGIERITGDLVVDGSGFPGRRHPLDRALGDLPYGFGTPPAALAIAGATLTLRVAPGAEVGAPAVVRGPPGLSITNLTRTVGRDRHGAGTLDFLPAWGTDQLVLRGEYPISEPSFTVPASDPIPEIRVARRLRDQLVEAGVSVDGVVRLATGGIEAGAGVVAEYRSPPLRDLLDAILTRSHNWYADMLVLTLGREVAGTGRFDDGVEVLVELGARALAAPDSGETARQRSRQTGLWLRDGSGLSPANLVTPRALVGILEHALTQPWGTLLVDALARPGRGTLGAWPSLPALSAKTGTLRHTVGLAGVLGAGSEAPVLFCYFVNHDPEGASRGRREIARAVTGWSAR